jgi:hypothetical protein
MRTGSFGSRWVLAVAAMVVGLVVAPLAVSPAAASGLEQGRSGGRTLATVLVGAEEAPGPGDPGGIGFAVVRVNPGRERICYLLTAAGLDSTVVAAHIHRAPSGAPGPVVVPLEAPVSGFSAACADVERALATEIARSPGEFYVNVHTQNFPAGAIRGQLGR